jgi:hypothetical protein
LRRPCVAAASGWGRIGTAAAGWLTEKVSPMMVPAHLAMLLAIECSLGSQQRWWGLWGRCLLLD